MSFYVPVTLTAELARTGLILGAALLSVCSLTTRYVYNSIRNSVQKLRLMEVKHSKRLEEQHENRRHSQEYLLRIADWAKLVAQTELENNGLVILEAFYGSRDAIERLEFSSGTVEVTLQLQYLVENSTLYLDNSPKLALEGFYNPLSDPSEVPNLYIKYSYGGSVAVQVFKDTEEVDIP